MAKGKEIIIFVKSKPSFDVYRQYLDVSLIDSQTRVSRFCCKFFTVLLFLENLAQLSSIFIF